MLDDALEDVSLSFTSAELVGCLRADVSQLDVHRGDRFAEDSPVVCPPVGMSIQVGFFVVLRLWSLGLRMERSGTLGLK